MSNIDAQKLRPRAGSNGATACSRLVSLMHEINGMPAGTEATERKVDELGSLLHQLSKSPDYVMDKGHYFGAALTEQERQDLIDLLRTF